MISKDHALFECGLYFYNLIILPGTTEFSGHLIYRDPSVNIPVHQSYRLYTPRDINHMLENV